MLLYLKGNYAVKYLCNESNPHNQCQEIVICVEVPYKEALEPLYWVLLAFSCRWCRWGEEARQSHDGYQLLLGERILLFYGWNRGSHPPGALPLSR